jgi:seryl-tRNA(Sec) selenium transferase
VSLLAAFGLAPIINAYGTNTRLSAGPLSEEVAEAMREAARASVDVLDAITPETAGILQVAQPHAEASLCAAVKPLGVPVIVDAAAKPGREEVRGLLHALRAVAAQGGNA